MTAREIIALAIGGVAAFGGIGMLVWGIVKTERSFNDECRILDEMRADIERRWGR